MIICVILGGIKIYNNEFEVGMRMNERLRMYDDCTLIITKPNMNILKYEIISSCGNVLERFTGFMTDNIDRHIQED